MTDDEIPVEGYGFGGAVEDSDARAFPRLAPDHALHLALFGEGRSLGSLTASERSDLGKALAAYQRRLASARRQTHEARWSRAPGRPTSPARSFVLRAYPIALSLVRALSPANRAQAAARFGLGPRAQSPRIARELVAIELRDAHHHALSDETIRDYLKQGKNRARRVG